MFSGFLFFRLDYVHFALLNAISVYVGSHLSLRTFLWQMERRAKKERNEYIKKLQEVEKIMTARSKEWQEKRKNYIEMES